MPFICTLFAVSFLFLWSCGSVLLTVISSITITVYTYTTNKDFGYVKLLVVAISLFWAYCYSFLLNITMLEQVCPFVATLLFGVYLTYDTQDILKKYDCDNAFDSLLIYIDIARLFLTILAMLGKSRKK